MGGRCVEGYRRLRSQHTDLKTCTLHSDHGIGVVYKGRNDRKLSYSLEQIDAMTYEDLLKIRSGF